MKKLISFTLLLIMLISCMSISSGAINVSLSQGKDALVAQWQSGEGRGLDYRAYSPVKDENDNTPNNDSQAKNKPTPDNSNLVIAECCHPLPGDSVVGFKDPITHQIIVHKANQTIVWTNLGLTTADRQVKIAERGRNEEFLLFFYFIIIIIYFI